MGYKKYHNYSTMDFFIRLDMKWLVDQTKQNYNLKRK